LTGYFNLSYSYYKEGYYKKAIDALKKAIEIKPDNHKAYNKLEKYQKAIKACLKAIKIKSDFYEAYNTMGFAYIALRGTFD
jgi:tetratricopeptide (TPR) repeat protein